MMARLFCALAVACLFVGNPMFVSKLSAQTIRFDTNVGTFDMRLNPTGNPFLQGHVDNMLAYVMAGRYDLTVINRAPNFIIQMGGFSADTLSLPSTARGTVNTFTSAFSSVTPFDRVVVDTNGNNVVSFDTAGLSNTRNTVTLALSSNNQQIPLVSSGSNSFFVNLQDNSNLDVGQARGGFIPFAEIENMETINLISALTDVNLNPANVPPDTPNSNLAVQNIPVLENNRIVIIEQAFVLDATDAMIESALANNTLDDFVPGTGSNLASALSTPSVPEPASLLLAGAMALLSVFKRRR